MLPVTHTYATIYFTASNEGHSMAKIYDLAGRRRVSKMEFMDILATIEQYIEKLRPLRSNQNLLNNAVNIVKEMKFNGLFDAKFRNQHIKPLEDLLDDMYIELATKAEDE
jgi:hypothetical protein